MKERTVEIVEVVFRIDRQFLECGVWCRCCHVADNGNKQDLEDFASVSSFQKFTGYNDGECGAKQSYEQHSSCGSARNSKIEPLEAGLVYRGAIAGNADSG